MKRILSLSAVLVLLLSLCSCVALKKQEFIPSVDDVPAFSDSPYVEINGNVPFFTESEITDESFESYSPLDSLGRCKTAFACISPYTMPTEERGSIGQVKPVGWHTTKYDIVDGKYLYNRCHLIGYQLSGENANTQNLITGTRYMNVEGMLPFENMIAEYVEKTENHVMYRVTPVYDGDNLLASGLLLEALSVEDNGRGIRFNVYVYNNQPGVVIDYKTGDSHLESGEVDNESVTSFVVNISSKKFHRSDCGSVKTIKPENKKTYSGERQSLIDNGYSPCGTCNP